VTPERALTIGILLVVFLILLAVLFGVVDIDTAEGAASWR
jgi:hypothetical protein